MNDHPANVMPPLSHAEIAARAYAIYVDERCPPGCELEHWCRAERELLDALAATADSTADADSPSPSPDPPRRKRRARAASGRPGVPATPQA